MTSRADEKRRRREERERRAAAEASAERRRRRLWILGGVVVAAAAAVAVLALASGGGDDGPQGLGGGSSLEGEAAANRLFAGLPQRGMTVGDPDAPVTLVEFVDLQCPFCGRFAREELPELARRHVRTGDVRLELRVLTFLGEDSLRAGRVAAAASAQDRGWQFADLFFANQGQESSGYATDEFLRRIAEGVAGLDADRALADARGARATAVLRRAAAAAETLGVQSTPTFAAGPTGGRLELLALAQPSADAIGAEIERIAAR